MGPRPRALLVAAVIEAAEAAGVFAASAVAAADTAAGHSYHQSSGIALAVIGFCTGLALVTVAAGLFRVRRWTRTPALFTQLFVGSTGFYLLQDHHVALGLPALLVAVAGFVCLLLPSSLRVLVGPRDPGPAETAEPAASSRRR
ncbi:MAG TPA: hypothetical protein VKV33_09120 [Streptosporangiaceae bacterium]|nr:hypothetical protein [Streptosporangiaceae bacterium]